MAVFLTRTRATASLPQRAPLDADIRSIEDRKTFLTNQALNIKRERRRSSGT